MSAGEPTIDVARGDPAVSRMLRDTLGQLKNHIDDPKFKELVDDVLKGKQGLREASRSDAFNSALGPLVQRSLQQYNQLSDDERRELAQRGEAQLARLRSRIAAEQAADDEDFGDRSLLI